MIIIFALCCRNLGVSKNVGDKIRKYRLLAGFNQEYVAEEIGMSGGNFGKIERGEIDINTEYLYKLAKLFKISVGDFFEEKPVSVVAEKPNPYGYATQADLESLADMVRKLTHEIKKLHDAMPPKKKSKKKTS